MVRKLLSIYVRVGAGALNLAIRGAARGGDLAVGAVRTVLSFSGNGSQGDADVAVREPPARREPVTRDEAPPPAVDEASTVAEAVDDDKELVAEYAEPGAEDGASAELEVTEPWDGYGDMTADEVTARIGEADTAELAVVELYERTHKQRRTVLAAADRRLRALDNAPS